MVVWFMVHMKEIFFATVIVSALAGIFYYVRYRKLIKLEIENGQRELNIQANQIADLLYDREMLEEKFLEVQEKNARRKALIEKLRDAKEDEVENLLCLIDQAENIDDIDITNFIN
jgi:ABC-type transport system involved in cytochrome c biogenesis permease subunit